MVFVVWGSTYLAIRVGVADVPPLLFAGLRFSIAGLCLSAWIASRGGSLRVPRGDWRTLVPTGLLLLAAANGFVVWSERWVPSNQTALITATSALWLTGFASLGPRAERPGWLAGFGILLGFAGVALLVGEGLIHAAAPVAAYVALQLSPLCWAIGSIWVRRRPPQCAPLTAAAMQMLIAGPVLLALAALSGEFPHARFTLPALGALAYLIGFGSCLAYATYLWLIFHVRPTTLAVQSYVNPATAVLLGWLLLGETLNPRQCAGMGVILLGVLAVTLRRRSSRTVEISAESD